MKIKSFIKFFVLMLVGTALGAAIFSFVVAKKLWFPNVIQTSDGKAGMDIRVSSYSPWLWNKKRMLKIIISDMKNDGPRFVLKSEGWTGDVRLIHGGWNFAVVSIGASEWTNKDKIYILHRVPKANGTETLEEADVPGDILAVAPDESGYFYYTEEKIFKSDWDGNTLMETKLPMRPEPIEMDPLFFNNNKKLAFYGTPWQERDGFLFIWDLEKNELKKIDTSKTFPGYRTLTVQDEKLYIEKLDTKILKALVDK